MRLFLINPCNTEQSDAFSTRNRLFRFFIYKPLNLLVLAGLTPIEWETEVIDENIRKADYTTMSRPDLVGITAFTSQAVRAYEIADGFRSRGIPVVMGGIHASMCAEEAIKHVDSVVTGEAESVWVDVLGDAVRGTLKSIYRGTLTDMKGSPIARHELLTNGYHFGSIQTTRGCPLNCNFCSVTAFNGRRYRKRPIENVVEEFKHICEKFVLIVDDNLIGTRTEHIERAKELYREMINAKLGKKWMAQVTINMADDEELLRLASDAGCFGVYIGIESITEDGMVELKKSINLKKTVNIKESIKNMHRHGILVCGSFIIGLDVDRKGIGRKIAAAAELWELDAIAVQFMTPLPGTRLWENMEETGRIAANRFPDDWKYYTLLHPVVSYKNFTWPEIRQERYKCLRNFYSLWRILLRGVNVLLRTRRIGRIMALFVTSMGFRLEMKRARDSLRRVKVRNSV
jgi:radical SAM superfamily enzyme YgiQ (UPF0313 family)